MFVSVMLAHVSVAVGMKTDQILPEGYGSFGRKPQGRMVERQDGSKGRMATEQNGQ